MSRRLFDELKAMFAADDTTDYARMRRLAIIITLPMADRQAAEALHRDLEAAISMYQAGPFEGQFCFEMLEDALRVAASHH